MWMKTRFAQWEVEGEGRERANKALRQSEHARLAQKAKGAEAKIARGGWLRSVKRGVNGLALRGRAALGVAWSALTNRSEPEQECY